MGQEFVEHFEIYEQVSVGRGPVGLEPFFQGVDRLTNLLNLQSMERLRQIQDPVKWWEEYTKEVEKLLAAQDNKENSPSI